MTKTLTVGELKTQVIVETTIYEEIKPSDKNHIRVGYGKMTVADIVRIDITIFKDQKEDRLWVALPMKPKDKKFNPLYIPREIMEEINSVINSDNKQEESTEAGEQEDVPWEMGL